MKHLAVAAALLPGLALAAPVGHPGGANLTYGDVSIHHNMMSNITNPAYGASSWAQGDGEYRFGLLNGGFFYEMGKLDDIVDEADAASTALENSVSTGTLNVSQAGGTITITNTATSGSATIDPDQVISDSLNSMAADGYDGSEPDFNSELSSRVTAAMTAEVDAAVNNLASTLVDDINNTISPTVVKLNDDGYLKGGLMAHVPFSPLVISNDFLKGSLALSASLYTRGKAHYHSSYIQPAATVDMQGALQFAGGDATDANNYSIDESAVNPSYDIASDAAVVTKIANITEFGLGYSRSVLGNEQGKLVAGARVNLYRVGLSTSYTSLEGSQETDDLLEDQMDASLDMENGVGLDVGAMWVADNYSLGATVNNLNSPSFDFTNVTDCTTFNNYVDPNDANNNVTSTVRIQCNTAESYTMDPQVRLEAVASVWDEAATLGLGYDANGVKDPFGDEYQWLTVSAGANWGNWAAGRIGYRANQADKGLTYYSVGLTLFGVSLDVAWSDETITFEGDEIPRSVYANLGWGLSF